MLLVFLSSPVRMSFNFFFFYLKIYFYYFFIGKADIQRGETERKVFRPMIHSPSERNGRYYANPKPGSRNFFWVSHMEALGRPRLLSQAITRELAEKLPGLEPAPIWSH